MMLSLLPEQLAVCRLEPHDPLPAWAQGGPLLSITRTADELSILCGQSQVPPGVLAETGWRALKVAGPLGFSMVGVISSLAGTLARAKVSIFALSTFDTDYILVKQADLADAIQALRDDGHTIP